MDLTDEKLPMDNMDAPLPSPSNDVPNDAPPANDRPRDEAGRFAPKPEGDGPRGTPNDDLARRRYAQERDEARNEAAQAKAAFEALQKRLDDMAALAKGDDPTAPKEPVDPLKPVIEKLEGIDKRFADQDQQRQQEETHRQVLAYADQDEAQFRTTTPDFPNAVQHYITSRLTEMQALGVDQAQAEAILAQEAQQLLYRGAETGKSPAETLYNMAKARGYIPGAVTVDHRPSPAPQPQNFGGRTMGTGNGPAGGAMTAAQIAALSDDEYMAFRATPEGKRAIARAMGG